MTITDRLNDLITAGEDIKSAIIEKGVEVTGGLTSYADAIRQIESGTSILIEVPINTRFAGSEWNAAPIIETTGWTDMYNMFHDCKKLTTIPSYNTSKVTNMKDMFLNCYLLTTVPLFDTGGVTNVEYMFWNCISLTTVGGFKDLGKQSSLDGTHIMIFNCPKLTYESIMNIINNLYDRATAGYSVLTLRLNTDVFALLSDEDIAIATNKGWTITRY